MKPYLVQSIGKTDPHNNKISILYNTKPKVQMCVPYKKDQLDVIKKGLYQVVHGTNGWGTGRFLKKKNQLLPEKLELLKHSSLIQNILVIFMHLK